MEFYTTVSAIVAGKPDLRLLLALHTTDAKKHLSQKQNVCVEMFAGSDLRSLLLLQNNSKMMFSTIVKNVAGKSDLRSLLSLSKKQAEFSTAKSV